ncbi:MAG: Hsp33 family molecular chaperone HslO [Deltaproteobacteria bacterium]|nr:Hsp33 family molecular chaperone HslO [Deltaproteobacteria bacterium]
MIKKKVYGNTLKERLLAGIRDRLYVFLLAGGEVRGAVINGTRMINEMRANHDLGILETLVLGHAYLGAGLMSAGLKGNDRISLQIECSGPIKGLVVEANAFGEVRGYLKNVHIPVDKPLEDFDLSPFFGIGFITVTKYLEDAKQPFMGRVALQYGNLAQDLANYYLTSEQIPTAFNLSVRFDSEGKVIGAGGLVLQAMPGARKQTIERVENLVRNLPSIGTIFAEDRTSEEKNPDKQAPAKLVKEVFKSFSPKFLADYRVEFMCHCNEKRICSLLTLLPLEDLKDILEKGPFPVEILCHNCNTPYHFTQADIKQIYEKRFEGL